MNNEIWLKTKGIPILQLIKEDMKCYSTCQNIDVFCRGVLSAINNDKVDYIAV